MDAQTSAANRVGRWGVLLAAIVLVGASAPGMRAGQQLTLADVERFVVGTWALAEWHENGEVLAPPTISGRWQLHDGQAMSIYHRDTDGIAWDQYSYGTYSTDQAGWTYGWDRRLEVTRKAGGEATVVQTQTPYTRFTPRMDGQTLVLDYNNGERSFRFSKDEYVYIVSGQILRKWRRVRG